MRIVIYTYLYYSDAMKLQDITQKLLDDHGFGQRSLAEELTSRGAECTQPTVGRILKGRGTSDTIGQAIRLLLPRKE